MKVALFGASGMVGQGVLRECLRDPRVSEVLSVVRTPTGQAHAKLRELVHRDFGDLAPLAGALAGVDACFFCLGVSAAGMSEDAYRRVTYDIAVAAAETLARVSPGATFVYVSGQGTDTTERGRVMWARVKGATENAILRLPLRAYMFRPGIIRPLHGIRSRTRLYRLAYALLGPILPLLERIVPGAVTDTERVGRAMLALAADGSERTVFGNAEINQLARATGSGPSP